MSLALVEGNVKELTLQEEHLHPPAQPEQQLQVVQGSMLNCLFVGWRLFCLVDLVFLVRACVY